MATAAALAQPGDWSEIRGALRANLLPGLVLWSIGVAVVAAFYLLPAAQPAFARIAAAKSAWGFAFSGLATGIFGGLLPWLAARLLGRDLPFSHGLLLTAMCTWRGMEVDAFYRLQGLLFGNEVDFSTVAAKVFLDQCGYTVFWSSPTLIALFAWRDGGFTWAAWWQAWRPATILARLRVVVLCNGLVWTPAICLIYSLPPDLQIPLFSLAATFWSLAVLVLTGKKA